MKSLPVAPWPGTALYSKYHVHASQQTGESGPRRARSRSLNVERNTLSAGMLSSGHGPPQNRQ